MTLLFAHRAAKTALLAGEISVLAWLFATEDLSQLGFLIVVIGLTLGAVALVFKDWPIGCVVFLVIGAAMSRFNVTWSSLHLRPEYVTSAVAILAAVVLFLRGGVELNLRLRSFDYWLIAYVGLNFFSSGVTSPEPRMTLRWATVNAL